MQNQLFFMRGFTDDASVGSSLEEAEVNSRVARYWTLKIQRSTGSQHWPSRSLHYFY